MNNNKTTPITEAKSSKAINAKIASVRKNAGAWNNLVQETGLAIMAHAQQYGDCTGAARLYDAMPKSSRRALLAKWLQMFGPIAIYTDKKTKQTRASFRKEESKAYNKFNIAGAEKTPWYDIPEAQKEPSLKDFEDFRTSFHSFFARWDKMLNPEEGQEPVIKGQEDRDRIKAKLEAIKAAVKEPVA